MQKWVKFSLALVPILVGIWIAWPGLLTMFPAFVYWILGGFVAIGGIAALMKA